MRHSDAVGSGQGEDSKSYDINRRDSDGDNTPHSDETPKDDSTDSGNPDTVDVSEDPKQ